MQFKEEWDFLSNFFPCEVGLDELTFPSVEHAYQAAKTLDVAERVVILIQTTPGRAKRAGRLLTIRPDWESVKIGVMRSLLIQKFSKPVLWRKLVAIEGPIVEDNNWGDTFWGRCDGEGRNELGKLLMEIRDGSVS